MADETRETREQDAHEHDAPEGGDGAPQDVEGQDVGDERSYRDEPAPPDDDRGYEEPAPELGQLNRDYTIPASRPRSRTRTAGIRARSATTAARTRSRSSTSSSSSAARAS
jgi:hypothetical protein